MANHRIDRINEEIKKELSSIVRGMKDPRIDPLVSVTKVETTPDLRYCKVFVSCLDEGRNADTVKGLASGAGYIRREIGSRIKTYYTPQFVFAPDNSISNGVRIAKLLDDVTARDEAAKRERGDEADD